MDTFNRVTAINISKGDSEVNILLQLKPDARLRLPKYVVVVVLCCVDVDPNTLLETFYHRM